MRQRSAAQAADVLLVSMPFGPLHVPSIGLSLLRASVPGVRCHIRYLTLPFAERIGVALYDWFSRSSDSRARLAGEWIFSSDLFGSGNDAVERYRGEILGGARCVGELDAERERAILGARDEVSGFLDRSLDAVLDCRPRLVGFTSVFQQQVASLALARRIKLAAPDVQVVLGGANCEGIMGLEAARQFDFLDAVVSGKADRLFPELVRRALAGARYDDMDGVLTPESTGAGGCRVGLTATDVAEMDALPYPVYGDYFDQLEASAAKADIEPEVPFETSRGCWWGEIRHCTFCGLNGGDMRFRSKSASRALDELERLTRSHPGLKVLVVDNILDPAYFEDFIPELAARELGLRLFYEVKSNLSKAQVRLLRDAGITEVQPGIESLSTEVLRIMRKGVTALQNIQLLKWCEELGVVPGWLLLWGFPGEPAAEYQRMAEMVPLLAHLPPPHHGQRVRVDRFSPSFERARELGFVGVRPEAAYAHVYPLPAPVVANLAYSFTFEYEDDREVGVYTQPLADAIEHWKESYPSSRLVHLDQGARLLVWDSRPCARSPLHILEGDERALYLACDQARSLTRLEETLSAGRRRGGRAGRLEGCLESLVELGLMLRQGDLFLALATAADASEGGFGEAGAESVTMDRLDGLVHAGIAESGE